MRLLFIDDSGNRKDSRREPYFCLGGVSIDGDHLLALASGLNRVKDRWGLKATPDDEVKLAHVGMRQPKRGKPHPLLDHGHVDVEERRRFILEVLAEVGEVKSIEAMVVGIYKPDLGPKVSPECLALDLLGERFQMSLQTHRSVGVVVCDEEQKSQGPMRQLLYDGGDFFKYTMIAETMMFVPSHHSAGIQVADYVCGAAARWWNWGDDSYLRVVEPYLRRYRKTWHGAGLKTFPGDRYPNL